MIYIGFIVLDPTSRFTWIQNEWEEEYIDLAKKVMLDLVSVYL
jgi:hypothetical protein